jgi:GT2 family glycosyltransferase
MILDARIPYSPDANLGQHYNETMKSSASDWTVFVDHDVFLANPHWHHILSTVIRENPKAGLITCWTNRIGRALQRHPKAPKGDDVRHHRGFAKALFERHGFAVSKISSCSGMIMCIRREAWEHVGGCKNGFFDVDSDLSRKIAASPYQVLRANGLYVYHLYNRSEPSWIAGERVSRDFL